MHLILSLLALHAAVALRLTMPSSTHLSEAALVRGAILQYLGMAACVLVVTGVIGLLLCESCGLRGAMVRMIASIACSALAWFICF